MFNLIYRDGARENAGHYETREKVNKNQNMRCGQVVVKSTEYKLTNDVSQFPETITEAFLVCADSPAGEKYVVVMRITHDMIFAVPIAEDVVESAVTQDGYFGIEVDDDGDQSIKYGGSGLVGFAREYGDLKAGDIVEVRFAVR